MTRLIMRKQCLLTEANTFVKPHMCARARTHRELLPGNINENQALDIWKLNLMLIHLQLDFLMKISGVTHFLQAHLDVDTFVVKSAGREGFR